MSLSQTSPSASPSSIGGSNRTTTASTSAGSSPSSFGGSDRTTRPAPAPVPVLELALAPAALAHLSHENSDAMQLTLTLTVGARRFGAAQALQLGCVSFWDLDVITRHTQHAHDT
jgi:hypothetical protein